MSKKPRSIKIFNGKVYFYRGSTTNILDNKLTKIHKKFLKEKGHSIRTIKEGKTTHIYSKV